MKRETDKIRFNRIIESGYILVKKWVCDFDYEVKINSEMREYINSLDHIRAKKLEIRDSYFGGRVNATKLYHKCVGNEKIHYYDVCSLYPYVLKYYSMPIGVPKVLIGEELNGRTVENIDGIILCKVLPPKELYHPVLPIKMHNKLLFILCYTCSLEKTQGKCTHSESERAFVGTYVADELRLAVRHGYKILTIFEAYEYQLIKFDKAKNKPGLFSGYIDFFLKMKAEASGYPEWVKTESVKDKYIKDYLKN